MKRHLSLIYIAIAALVPAAWAEGKSARQMVQTQRAEARMTCPRMELLKGEVTARSFMGRIVKNRLDETLGQMADIVLYIESGRIVAVSVATDGVLDTGPVFSALPPKGLRMHPGADSLQLGLSKAFLRNAPHFRLGDWPDFTHTGSVGGNYSAYQLQPSFITDTGNSKLHDQAHCVQMLTPCNRGGSKNDMATTAQIHTEISATKDLSANARNVQVTTLEGHVTLQGPVNTAAEKCFIDEITTRLVGSRHLDSQLKVPATTSSNKIVHNPHP